MQNLSGTYDNETKIWRSPTNAKLDNESDSIGQVILRTMRCRNAEDICQISDSDGIALKVGEILTSAIRIAQHLKQWQLSSDDVVGMLASNITYSTCVAAACWFNGSIFHPISNIAEEYILKHRFEVCQPKVIFCDGVFYDILKRTTASFDPLIYTLCNHLEGVPKVEDLLEPTSTEQFYQAEPLKYGPDQTVAIIVSSGTTGLPKCVCFSSSRACAMDLSNSSGSSILFTFAGLDWGTGLSVLLMNLLNGGKRIITKQPYTPEYLMKIITKYQVNILMAGPFFITQMIQLPACNAEALRSLRIVIMAGSPCSAEMLQRIRSVITMGVVVNSYGTSETATIANNISDYKSNSVGKIVNVQVKIIDEKTGKHLGPNEVGEICAAKPGTRFRYYRSPHETNKVVDDEGFMHTGDLGYIDDEGYLYLVGRSKDMIRFEELDCYPHGIEETIAELEDVVDVCVFGVPDELRGNIPAAAVVTKKGSFLNSDDIVKYVESRTAVREKRIHYGVFFVDEIPRSKNGKVLRRKISELCMKMII